MLGSQVNVTGTVNVFEAAKRHGLETPIAYASSAAVYDAQEPSRRARCTASSRSPTRARPGSTRPTNGVASVGLRPFTVYGPGRDQGLTAGPTLAIAAAVRGEPYRIAFGGRTQLHYAPDVARAFIQAARSPSAGAQVFSLGGPAMSIADFAALVVQTVPGADVTFDEPSLPFPDELPEPWFDWPLTPLDAGVRETAEVLRRVV